MSKLNVCVACATGWAGSALARGIVASDALALVAAVSRSRAGKTLGEVPLDQVKGLPETRGARLQGTQSRLCNS